MSRDFATATRNYAKRQMHWYRKDEKFLFVEIGTKSVTNENDNENVDNYDKNIDYDNCDSSSSNIDCLIVVAILLVI